MSIKHDNFSYSLYVDFWKKKGLMFILILFIDYLLLLGVKYDLDMFSPDSPSL